MREGTGNLAPGHLKGGMKGKKETPLMISGTPSLKPESVHGTINMAITDDAEIVKDEIMQKFSKRSTQAGYGFVRDDLHFQTYDNGDETMTVVFDAG